MKRIISGHKLAQYSSFRSSAARHPVATKLDALRTKSVFKLLFFLGFVVILCLAYTWSRIQVVRVGYDLNDLKNEQQELREFNKKLKAELSILESPQRLKKLAEEEWGMTFPYGDKLVEFNPEEGP